MRGNISRIAPGVDNGAMLDALRYADRSERAKLRVTGQERAWFLDQILTQSFQDMEPGEARDAALITVHGRMTGYMEAVCTDEAFLLHLEPDLGKVVGSTLQRYILATRVEVSDVTDDFGLVLMAGPGWREAASGLATGVVQPTSSLGLDAGYVWTPRTETGAAIASIQRAGGGVISEDELEAIRISQGVPRWGREMDEKTFPQEAGVDERAVHYEKGCYLGQEAMAKIHFRGKVNRRLARLRADAPVPAGADVLLAGAMVGKVTSASDGTALALVRYTVEPGATVTIGEHRAEVVA
jgi:folate-binding protein YgfZ